MKPRTHAAAATLASRAKPVQLEALQADFAAALLDGHAAPALLPSLQDCGERTLGRLELYRGNLHAAWDKVLGSAFPVVRALVGDEFFTALGRAYGRTHPSSSGDLNTFGAGFAGFASRFEHARSLPYLGDVAALEWAVHRAHYAADANALPRERMAAISPHDLLRSHFALQPALSWIESEFPVASIWQAHQPQATVDLPDALDRRECALVARPRWRVEVVASSSAEIAALAQLRDGADMDGAIGAAINKDKNFDFAKAFLRWLNLAILADMRLP
jgi:hypothetical protein